MPKSRKPISINELSYMLNMLRYKIAIHIEERGLDNLNQGYMLYLESEIEYIETKLRERSQVA